MIANKSKHVISQTFDAGKTSEIAYRVESSVNTNVDMAISAKKNSSEIGSIEAPNGILSIISNVNSCWVFLEQSRETDRVMCALKSGVERFWYVPFYFKFVSSHTNYSNEKLWMVRVAERGKRES
jgi:hypothetical protein